MTARRGRGEGSLYWDEQRKRWRGEITIGYGACGMRVTRKVSGETKTEAKNKLKEIQRDYDDGLIAASSKYTVGDAVAYWLAYYGSIHSGFDLRRGCAAGSRVAGSGVSLMS